MTRPPKPLPTMVGIAALCVLALPVEAQRERRRNRPEPELKHGTFTTHNFESEALKGAVANYGIYLPNSYQEADQHKRRYPLVVWLHGMNEDHRRFHTRGGSEVLDKMMGAGDLPEMVVVTANGGRASFYVNGAGGAYENLITEDLLAHLEATYRVEKDPRQRALIGVSMGGNGALRIAFQHPELFGAVAAHSAAILPRDPDQLDEQFPWLERWGGGQRALAAVFGSPFDRKRWDATNVLLIAEQLEPKAVGGLKLYLDCGDEDRYGFAKPNEELHAILDDHKIPHTWRLVPGGNHGWRNGYNQAAMPESLKFVAAAWAAAKGTSGLDGLMRTGGGKGDSGKGDGKHP